MKYLKKSLKLFIFLIIFIFITFFGLIIYIKMSPKLEIRSANAFLMYDGNNELFFKGSGGQEWVNLDEISDYVKLATINMLM